MKERTEKPISGYDFNLKKDQIKKIFNTPEYQEYKEKKKKTQKNEDNNKLLSVFMCGKSVPICVLFIE